MGVIAGMRKSYRLLFALEVPSQSRVAHRTRLATNHVGAVGGTTAAMGSV